MNGPSQMKDEKTEVSNEILRYLIDNPDAGDTLEGVKWWLLARKKKYPETLVKKALEKLVSDELLIAHEGSDSRTHYRINRRQRKEIVSRLRDK